MRNFVALTRRELLSVFVSPLAYGTGTVFLFLFGLVFVGAFTKSKLVEVNTLITPLGYVLPVLVSPVLTMRLLAEERKQGTLEMLMTAPVGDFEVVLSKFMGVWIFYGCNVALTGFHVLAMLYFYDGQVDWGSFFTGYLAMMFIAALFLSFGLFVSGLFDSPILAALISFFAGLTALMVGYLVSSPIFLQNSPGMEVFKFLLPFEHYKTFLRGLLDTRSVAYFTLTTAYFLFLSTKVVESRKWA